MQWIQAFAQIHRFKQAKLVCLLRLNESKASSLGFQSEIRLSLQAKLIQFSLSFKS